MKSLGNTRTKTGPLLSGIGPLVRFSIQYWMQFQNILPKTSKVYRDFSGIEVLNRWFFPVITAVSLENSGFCTFLLYLQKVGTRFALCLM